MSRGACMDVAQGMESLPIEVTNVVDDEMPPCIQYTPDYVAGPGCPSDPSEIALPGCECSGGRCAAPPAECPCLRGGVAGGAPTYDPAGRLVFGALAEGGFARPIFECNPLCSCGDACPSRVVQKGLALRLQVFRTARKGWAVRSLEPVPRGGFVCEYVGELLGAEEARRRVERQAESGGGATNYLIAARERRCYGDGRASSVADTYVDPERVGNVGRFLNHSCEPNLAMALVRVHSTLPRLALFAARDVAAGEELCYDYSGEFGNPRSAPETRAPSPRPGSQPAGDRETGGDNVERKPCFCGARSCRGFLPFDPTVFADAR